MNTAKSKSAPSPTSLKWPPALVEGLRILLKGGTAVPHPGDVFDVIRSLPHGHVAAVLGTLKKLGLDRLIDPQPSARRNQVLVMIVARILEPASKLADSRATGALEHGTPGEHFDWVITCPPYYGMRTYILDQWLRNWFVSGSDTVDYNSKGQLVHFSIDDFSEYLRQVWQNAFNSCSEEANLVIRFGGINDRNVEPLALIKSSLADTGWRIKTA